MKPVIVLGMKNGIVECISNPTNVDVILHDFDIQDTDNSNFVYGEIDGYDFMVVRFPGKATPSNPQPNEPEPKPLAQYLGEYVEQEIIENPYAKPKMWGILAWHELLKQALDAYESTEQVKIRIERV